MGIGTRSMGGGRPVIDSQNTEKKQSCEGNRDFQLPNVFKFRPSWRDIALDISWRRGGVHILGKFRENQESPTCSKLIQKTPRAICNHGNSTTPMLIDRPHHKISFKCDFCASVKLDGNLTLTSTIISPLSPVFDLVFGIPR